jgi:hypothetical protein
LSIGAPDTPGEYPAKRVISVESQHLIERATARVINRVEKSR